ncbi:MAG TPA: transposase [Gallionellaceae bacterium]|nr:transposase [Gallionellaceae bacterium]
MPLHFHSSGLRKGRYSAPGHAYLITTVTRARRPLFVEMRPARLVINAIRYHAEQGHVEPLAYVLMPDHLHWMFVLREPLSLPKLMASVKGYSARQINRLMAESDDSAVWQPGYHDHAVRQDEDLRAMARYVIANPIRAGLVKCVGDYPYWDAVWL